MKVKSKLERVNTTEWFRQEQALRGEASAAQTMVTKAPPSPSPLLLHFTQRPGGAMHT
jgi:hypothetical protein